MVSQGGWEVAVPSPGAFFLRLYFWRLTRAPRVLDQVSPDTSALVVSASYYRYDGPKRSYCQTLSFGGWSTQSHVHCHPQVPIQPGAMDPLTGRNGPFHHGAVAAHPRPRIPARSSPRLRAARRHGLPKLRGYQCSGNRARPLATTLANPGIAVAFTLAHDVVCVVRFVG